MDTVVLSDSAMCQNLPDVFVLGRSTEGAPSTRAVQDGLEWLQTGDRTHRDRGLIEGLTPEQRPFIASQSHIPITEMGYGSIKGLYPTGIGPFVIAVCYLLHVSPALSLSIPKNKWTSQV